MSGLMPSPLTSPFSTSQPVFLTTQVGSRRKIFIFSHQDDRVY